MKRLNITNRQRNPFAVYVEQRPLLAQIGSENLETSQALHCTKNCTKDSGYQEGREPAVKSPPTFKCAWCGCGFVREGKEHICSDCEVAQEWHRNCAHCGTQFDTTDPDRWECSICDDSSATYAE